MIWKGWCCVCTGVVVFAVNADYGKDLMEYLMITLVLGTQKLQHFLESNPGTLIRYL